MILNLSRKNSKKFSLHQKFATHGETVANRCAERSLDTLDRFIVDVGYPSRVIVDTQDFVLANDILNAYDIPVFTLNVEYIVDSQTHEFQEFDPKEHC